LLTFINMRKTFAEEMLIPEGVTCEIQDKFLICKHGETEVRKVISLQDAKISVDEGKIKLKSGRANKKTLAGIRALMAHIRNMFEGVHKKFAYELEICNVHFPMTVKVEGSKFVISNFLGEKEKRVASILPGVDVEVKGVKITVSSHDIESAGQTSANIEYATRVPKRDRRVFQDGIFITSKAGRPI